MANHPWENDGWERRNDATGLPEWNVPGGYIHLLQSDEHMILRTYISPLVLPIRNNRISNHEAACLIREHRREWLKARGLEIRIAGEGYCVWDMLGGLRLTADGFVTYAQKALIFGTYDEAQDAAIDYMLKE